VRVKLKAKLKTRQEGRAAPGRTQKRWKLLKNGLAEVADREVWAQERTRPASA